MSTKVELQVRVCCVGNDTIKRVKKKGSGNSANFRYRH